MINDWDGSNFVDFLSTTLNDSEIVTWKDPVFKSLLDKAFVEFCEDLESGSYEASPEAVLAYDPLDKYYDSTIELPDEEEEDDDLDLEEDLDDDAKEDS
jgi:hypothetical protein